MIIKLVGALIFIFSFSGFGLCIGKQNKVKIAEFMEFKNCISFIKNEMCVSFKSFCEALNNAAKCVDTTNNHIVFELLKCNDPDNDIELNDKIEKFLKTINTSVLYNDKDISVLEKIKKIICNSDIGCLNNNFLILESDIDKRISELNADTKNNNLFSKIAICVSFIIVVFLF